MGEITNIITKSLNTILKNNSAIKHAEEKIIALERNMIKIDRSKPISVARLDEKYEAENEKSKLESEITKYHADSIKAKEAIYKAVSGFEGQEIIIEYENEYRKIKIDLEDDIYGEKEKYNLYYNGGLL